MEKTKKITKKLVFNAIELVLQAVVIVVLICCNAFTCEKCGFAAKTTTKTEGVTGVYTYTNGNISSRTEYIYTLGEPSNAIKIPLFISILHFI